MKQKRLSVWTALLIAVLVVFIIASVAYFAFFYFKGGWVCVNCENPPIGCLSHSFSSQENRDHCVYTCHDSDSNSFQLPVKCIDWKKVNG